MRVCDGSPTCTTGQQIARIPTSDQRGTCHKASCFENADAAFRHLAKGNYMLWSNARHGDSGLWAASTDVTKSPPTLSQPSITTTGPGLIMECVADAMAWRPRQQVQERIIQTLSTLNGQSVNFKPIRTSDAGWFFDDPFQEKDHYELLGNGLVMKGILFSKRYFLLNDPGSNATATIVQLADALWNSVHYEKLLCDRNGTVSETGDVIPMVQGAKEPRQCTGQHPANDGFYTWNEEHYTVELAYRKGCAGQPVGQCTDKAIERMWQNWQGRRNHINAHYTDGDQTYELLSLWSGYIVHLPFYTCHSVNSDDAYKRHFHAHWQADWAFYNSSTHQGERGRYGLGAGPTPSDTCNGGQGYFADRIHDLWPCRMYSPYITAGYLPTSPEIIKPQLLALMEDGEAVLPMAGTDDFVLWRRSMLDVDWVEGYGITLVDFASELWGLSTIWLGADFYTKYTDHFSEEGVKSIII